MREGARVLVAGGEATARAEIATLLAASGFACTDLPQLSPSIVAGVDLVLVAGEDVVPACAAARQMAEFAHLPLVAIVPRSPSGVAAAAMAAGADDVVVEPVTAGGLTVRVKAQLRAAEDREGLRDVLLCEEALVEVQRILASGADVTAALREALFSALRVMGYDRASIVLLTDASDQGYVVAATDDPTLSKFVVTLDRYPELRPTFDGGEVVLVEDTASHPLTAERAAMFQEHRVQRLAVFPIEWKRVCGAVFYRSATRGGLRGVHGPRQMAFGRQVAGMFALCTRGGQLLDSLREQTHRISLARYETERRLRAIDQLKDYFEAAADGVVVLDGQGQILFVNHAAESITGFAKDGLLGRPLTNLVPLAQRDGLQDVIYRVLGGTNLETFDLDLTTTSGDPICVSMATSTVLSEHGAAILSFRDVTAERALETELRKTKEFLEKLIDSTVDAILAADIRGNLILFNQGAERVFGFRADEVIGQLAVEKLYPDGVARQIMRMLRSPSYGGVGRLELTRREIVTRQGDVVPVNMTASIIYEDGREVATVGILSDLRDRIRIEQRLLQAQEKLLLTEKQALVAELAGAAAHELNQPLTSVMGYAELLKRKMAPDDPHSRAIETIFREAMRMAEIVKKVGRITRYETKAYVGSAQILDLEKAADSAEPTRQMTRRES